MEAAVSNSKTSDAIDVVIAKRMSLERGPVTGALYEAHSRLMRKPNGKLYLVEETWEPGVPEIVTPISRKRAIDWLSANPARRRGAAAADRKRAERLLSAA